MNGRECDLVKGALSQIKMALRRQRPEDAKDGRYEQAKRQLTSAALLLNEALSNQVEP